MQCGYKSQILRQVVSPGEIVFKHVSNTKPGTDADTSTNFVRVKTHCQIFGFLNTNNFKFGLV